MKKMYKVPELNISYFISEDIICASGGDDVYEVFPDNIGEGSVGDGEWD